MNTHNHSHRRLCRSWYHQGWFRVLLVIVGIDMIILGFAFAVGLNIFELVPNFALVLRLVFGVAYMLVAIFIIHYALSYKKMKQEVCFVCHDCAHDQKEV